MTKIVGLTGGIGSGKTTIANHFKSHGVPVYIADDEARKIMESQTIKAEIKKVFGATLFDHNKLNRKELAKIVFNNTEKLANLNSIVHPAVRKHFKQWLSKQQDHPIIIYEAAILFESGNYKNCDFIITVTAPLELRMQRVIARDHTTKELVLKRINAQWTDEQRISKSDFIIHNHTIETTKLEVDKILKLLKIT